MTYTVSSGALNSTPSIHRSLQQCVAGLLLLAGDIDRLLQQWRANVGSATLSAYVGS